ncbi:hypothetical protein AC623_11350 [Bacillus sp. FJAT-27231]|uniref:hypothetical protein n=1 Tax=Bacillus sp. FJAT-27231 TaxID=1679168 RepID=UPI0006708FE3|nr:hypothetical protein [Bacillus sp. FJAT-27231]KMY54432.1 hypothetical protein AC623_11350 [Bacillus sp. FJAT-27231]
MTEENSELKNSIQRFYDLLKKYPDSPDAAYDFVVYLRSFLKIQSKKPLPTIEIMTLLKKYKPNVFYALRKMAEKNIMLNILTELPMESEAAEKKLKRLLNS